MSDDLTLRLNYPFLVGVYLAINAIPDAYLLVDGPDCIFHKAEHIHGRHDLYSTMLSCFGHHRIQFTGTDTEAIATSYEKALPGLMRKVASLPHCKALFFSSLPFCSIAGTDYGRLIRESFPQKGKPVIEIPGRSLEGDWLDGYEELLDAMAKTLDISGRRPATKKVAVVGYFMDRTEGDHTGNVAELKRMLKGLGLDPVSVWLSNSPYGDLRDIKNASAIISLPYARKAAATIAGRLNAKLIRTDLPFGLAPTCEWLKHIGDALGCEDQASAFIDREMRQIVPRLAWAIPHVFLNRKVVWVGDPYLWEGFLSLAKDIGLDPVAGFLKKRFSHPGQKVFRAGAKASEVIFEPKQEQMQKALGSIEAAGVDLCIGSAMDRTAIKTKAARMEFGFPSYHYHAYQEEPFLGFKGCLSFTHRMANAITSRFSQ